MRVVPASPEWAMEAAGSLVPPHFHNLLYRDAEKEGGRERGGQKGEPLLSPSSFLFSSPWWWLLAGQQEESWTASMFFQHRLFFFLRLCGFKSKVKAPFMSFWQRWQESCDRNVHELPENWNSVKPKFKCWLGREGCKHRRVAEGRDSVCTFVDLRITVMDLALDRS